VRRAALREDPGRLNSGIDLEVSISCRERLPGYRGAAQWAWRSFGSLLLGVSWLRRGFVACVRVPGGGHCPKMRPISPSCPPCHSSSASSASRYAPSNEQNGPQQLWTSSNSPPRPIERVPVPPEQPGSCSVIHGKKTFTWCAPPPTPAPGNLRFWPPFPAPAPRATSPRASEPSRSPTACPPGRILRSVRGSSPQRWSSSA